MPGRALAPDDDAWRAELAEIDGIYAYAHVKVSAELMDNIPRLKVISNFGVGCDHVDLAAAQERGIPVGNTPHVLDGATADITFALLLAGARNIVKGDHFARGPDFLEYDPSFMLGQEVHHQTLGIVGLGNIGYQVARRAQGFDMTVLYHNRNRNPKAEADLGARYVALDELLAQSDFVALNTPLTDETRGMIGARELGLMKESAVLVNAARGGVIDHDALLETMRAGKLHCAALDVTEPEPLPRDHPPLGARQYHRHPPPRQRHRADAPSDGRPLGEESAGRSGRQRVVEPHHLRRAQATGNVVSIAARAFSRRNHIPHTVIAWPSAACSWRRKILSFHGFPAVRSKITRCPDCAAQRSM